MAVTRTRVTVNEDSVIDAALTLFAERGFHGTALSEIAERLGIRTPSLYNHMRSKQELLRVIIDRTTLEVLDDFAAARPDSAEPPQQLFAATRVYARRHAVHRRQALVVNRDTDSLEEPYRSIFQDRRRKHEHEFRAIIAEGIKQGVFTAESSALASFAIREMCVSIARWFRPEGRYSPSEVADVYAGYALNIVNSDLKP